jgi:hypothetical protein
MRRDETKRRRRRHIHLLPPCLARSSFTTSVFRPPYNVNNKSPITSRTPPNQQELPSTALRPTLFFVEPASAIPLNPPKYSITQHPPSHLQRNHVFLPTNLLNLPNLPARPPQRHQRASRSNSRRIQQRAGQSSSRARARVDSIPSQSEHAARRAAGNSGSRGT